MFPTFSLKVTRELYLALFILSLFTLSCRKTQNTTEVLTAKSSSAFIIPSPVEADQLRARQEIIFLASLDLTQNPTIKNLLSDLLSNEMFDERISYSLLREEMMIRYNIDLLSQMEQSLINHKGSQSQLDSLPLIIDSFMIGNRMYRSFILIPFSQEVNLVSLDHFIGKSWLTPSNDIELMSSRTNEKAIENEATVFCREHPSWLVTFRSIDLTERNAGWNGWRPWKVCSCKPKCCEESNPDAGICNGEKNESNKCGRSNFWGTCSGNDCTVSRSTIQYKIKWNL